MRSIALSFAFFLAFQQLLSSPSQDQLDSLIAAAPDGLNNDYNEVLKNMSVVIAQAQKLKLPESEGYGYLYTGVALYMKGDHVGALEYYQKSLHLFESHKEPLGLARSCNEVGVFYSRQKEYQKAYEYYERAEQIAKANDFQQELAISLSNQGMSYLKREMLDEAFPRIQQSLEIKQDLNDSVGMGYELNRLANYYFQKAEHKKGIRYLNLSTDIRKALGDKQGMAINEVTIAELYHQQKDYIRAIEHFKRTLEQALAIGYSDLSRYCYDMLQSCYAQTGQYQDAYLTSRQASIFSDSILNESKAKAIVEMTTKYETVQKEQEITNQQLILATQESDLQTKRAQIFGLSGSLLVLLLFGLIYYNHYRTRQKEKLQTAILEEKERAYASVIKATEEERMRISKDLHDGIGQQMSALKMALENVKSKITSSEQKAQLHEISEKFTRSATEIRQLSHQMMPRVLMDYGLIHAVEDLLHSCFHLSNISYEFEHHLAENRLPEQIEITVYRVLQELINNIIKHAHATEVAVQLLNRNDKLILFVEDNGRGIPEESTKGHGLLNIKSRLNMVHGKASFESSKAHGTTTTVSIPI